MPEFLIRGISNASMKLLTNQAMFCDVKDGRDLPFIAHKNQAPTFTHLSQKSFSINQKPKHELQLTLRKLYLYS